MYKIFLFSPPMKSFLNEIKLNDNKMTNYPENMLEIIKLLDIDSH